MPQLADQDDKDVMLFQRVVNDTPRPRRQISPPLFALGLTARADEYLKQQAFAFKGTKPVPTRACLGVA